MLALSSVASAGIVQSWYDKGARLSESTAVSSSPSKGLTQIADLIGTGPETGLTAFDPLNLASDSWGSSDQFDKLAWFRHAEIKHGRVAMAAFVGYLATVSGTFLPGDLTLDGAKFSDFGIDPLDLWSKIGDSGRQQIIGSIGILELISETPQPHYTRGGEPGRVPSAFKFFFWENTKGMSEEEKTLKLVSELKNGRLAMIGMAGFYSAATIPGSVPLLKGTLIDGFVGGQFGVVFPGYGM